MTVWRAKIHSGRDGSNTAFWDAAKKHCRDAGVVGIGWGLPQLDGLPADPSIEDVLGAMKKVERKLARWKSGREAVARFARGADEGDYVWTRDSKGWWLGQIDGDWRFDSSDAATHWDCNNVRPCTWMPRRMRDDEVPGAVVRSFTGRAREFVRVAPGDQGGWRMTELIYKNSPITLEPQQVFDDLLDPTDAEDLALLYLQSQGWLLLPSSRGPDTPNFEAILRRGDGRPAVVAVKSGRAKVPVKEVVEAAGDAEVYVFSTHGNYAPARPEDAGATEIKRSHLFEFMSKRPELLPPRIARWL